MSKLNQWLYRIQVWAKQYEPATAKALVAAFFQMLLGLGIAVGDMPDQANAVLAFLVVVTTLIAGRSIRNSVYSPATHRAEIGKRS